MRPQSVASDDPWTLDVTKKKKSLNLNFSKSPFLPDAIITIYKLEWRDDDSIDSDGN